MSLLSEAPRRKAPGLPKGKALGGCRPQIPRFAIHLHLKRWGFLVFPRKRHLLVGLVILVAIAAVAVLAMVVSAGGQAARSVADSVDAIGVVNATIAATESITTYLPIVQGGSSGWWQPSPGVSWQWQLTDQPIDQSFDVDVYDIDMFGNDASTVAALHAQGRVVLCYISVGSWEDWRPDAGDFPAVVLGNDYEGWPGEKWLDIRRIDLLGPIMRARLDLCQAKGFDGVEPDNIDGYTNDTGFPLTYQDQLAYNIWLADEAHARGLSIGLKNDGDQAVDLVSHFDWAMTEDCFADEWCEEMAPFTDAGKAVLAAEYTDQLTVNQFLNQVCPQAEVLNLDVILKDRDLDAWRQGCP